MKRCWAHILGGCSAKMSKEHYLGRKLLTKVRATGLHPDLEGRDVPASALSAHILCKRHNEELGEADQEAINLRASLLRWFDRQEDVTQGQGFWTPTHIDVNARLFSRWLCKLHCNYQTLGGKTPDELFVRYAFGQQRADEPRFYLRASLGDRLAYHSRIFYSSYSFASSEPSDCCLFHVFFMGLHFLVLPTRLTNAIQRSLAEAARTDLFLRDWTERLRQLKWRQSEILTKVLYLHWESADTGADC